MAFGRESIAVDMGPYEYGSWPFRILAVMRGAGGDAELTWSSRPGDSYTVWSRSDLLTAQWIEEATITSRSQSTTWSDPHTTSPRKFYIIEMK